MVVKEKHTSPGIRQSLKILAWIARNPTGLGFNEIRDKVYHLPPSTLTRHLKVLCEENWIKKDEGGRYLPGPAFLCALNNMTGKPNPNGLVRPVLERLARERGHSVAFAVWDRGRIRFSLKKDITRSYCFPDSREILGDVFSHPFGLTALAFLPESVVEWNRDSRTEELAEAWGGLERGRRKLEELLTQIRDRGFYEEIYGCPMVCAPLHYETGDLAGVLGLSVMHEGKGDEAVALLKAVREIEALDL